MNKPVAELLLCCLLASLVCISWQQQTTPRPNFNPQTDGVVELTQKNFKTLVLNSDDQWLIIFQFSGNECRSCITVSDLIKKSVSLLKDKKIKVGFVEYYSPDGKKLIDAYQITVFPTLYIFGKDKEFPSSFLPYATNSVEEFVRSIVFNLNRPRPAEGTCGQDSVEEKESNLYELTDSNFEEVVLKCEDPWMVNFYLPDLEVCVQFQPYFNAAAAEFKGRVKFGNFFQLGSKVAEKYGVRSVCTVKLFPGGDKSGRPIDYNSGTHSSAINNNLIPWVNNVLASTLPEPTINELTSQKVLDSNCKNSGVTSCIFVILPNTDACNAECQTTYLNQLKQTANELKGKKWGWFWTTQGKQPEFQQAFGVQYFPGVFAVDMESKTFSVSRGSTSASKAKEFLNSYINGILPSKPTIGFPPVKQ